MTLEQKYAKAIQALREIAERGTTPRTISNDWDEGYDSGVNSCAEDARGALEALGEES